MLAFHGFGQDKSVFSGFARSFPKHKIYSFDLPFHGDSPNPEQDITKKLWSQYLNKLLVSEKIKRFDLIGFSIGSLFAIASFIEFKERVDSITLLAPDGIRNHLWKKVALFPFPNKLIFRILMQNQTSFLRAVYLMSKHQMLPRRIMKFTQYLLKEPGSSRLVYQSWTRFAPLQYSRRFILAELNNRRVCVVIGTRDYVISEGFLTPILVRMNKIHILKVNCLHHRLIEAYLKEIYPEHSP